MPTLPTELERLIFEIAAITHPYCMPSMLRVAHRIKIWIEPLLYGLLTILPESAPYPDTKTLFVRRIPDIRKLVNRKPASFLRQHVRHVCFIGFPSDDIVLQLLSACDAAIDLNLAFPTSSALISLVENLPLRRLCVDIKRHTTYHRPPPRFTLPCFSRLSHLHLYGADEGEWATWSGLRSLPCLTHLSFERDAAPVAIWHNALLKCPFLEVLVVLCDAGSAIEITTPYESVGADPRFVHLRLADYLADWECGARGGEDYWARADAVVNARRATAN
ncbi:hypothetical protein B0H13DRAFT_2070044 [Mycena leptocephala]|nr:hypothetical protein B0H13DRAFT_2070044 [Mycena leptocephala]